MKASELIEELQKLIAEHGDLDVTTEYDTESFVAASVVIDESARICNRDTYGNISSEKLIKSFWIF